MLACFLFVFFISRSAKSNVAIQGPGLQAQDLNWRLDVGEKINKNNTSKSWRDEMLVSLFVLNQ